MLAKELRKLHSEIIIEKGLLNFKLTEKTTPSYALHKAQYKDLVLEKSGKFGFRRLRYRECLLL